MSIRGIGTDILEINRFEQVYSRWGNKFINKIFNNIEVPNLSSKKKLIENLAGKFAAKEAISKAYGTGIGSSLSFKDITIKKDRLGKPWVSMNKNNKKEKVHISISHSSNHAIAFAILESLE
ncbi:MAG: holo-ACP synthase [Thermodesulfobacteriota bacterium]|nr:MAG: holo-[acyl-carrier-protein] synthase [Candidatus Dadabacteria bacterium]